MYAQERQTAIAEIVKRSGKVTVDALVDEFGVSAPTIRADLDALEQRNLLRRTHGGAIAPETTLYEPPYAERERSRQTEKARIGTVAARRVQDYETVLLDAGTTCMEVAVHLKERVGLTVVTNSLEAAWELMNAPFHKIEVVVVGGSVHARRRATLGPLAGEFLERIQVDRAFLGVNGVHSVSGYTVTDFDAASLKKIMAAKAREVVVVGDSAKMNVAAFASVGLLSLANVLITDAPLDASLAESLSAAGVEVIVAP